MFLTHKRSTCDKNRHLAEMKLKMSIVVLIDMSPPDVQTKLTTLLDNTVLSI